MPLYEYYCRHCDGIFEALRPMSASSKPAPCPECARAGDRLMPTSVATFTMREGYPRKLPDKGTYWHLGKEVKKKISGTFRPFEHPELNKPVPKAKPPKGEMAVRREKELLRKKELRKMQKSGLHPSESQLPKALRK